MNEQLKNQFSDSMKSVLPITGIVLLLALTIAPIEMGTLGIYIVGAILLIVGMVLFTLGVEMSLTPMGSHIGAHLTKSKNLWLMVIIAFVMGFFITIAEPDLAVLAKQVPGIPNMTLIVVVGIGVGIFLVVGFLRIVFQKRLNVLFVLFYAIVFGVGIFTSANYVPVAFDSGGVTTGPITVPFILALGVGIASVRSGKGSSEDDGFGLVGLGSIGPILAVMVLGIFYPGTPEVDPIIIANPANTHEMLFLFFEAIPLYLKEVGIALSPILITFLIFQVIFLHIPIKQLLRICVGSVYTYLGLVLFLTGVNVGFLPVGSLIGHVIGSLDFAWILLPIGMVIGFFIVAAEPAVYVLNAQVEDLTGGTISRKAMMTALSMGVSVSVGLGMIRVLTGISIWWIIVPGYALALLMAFIVPPVFTAIAFDSGGVASGAMTATFLLPFTMGACQALGGNIMQDAFGIVAMVAMTPLIAIQGLGLLYMAKERKQPKEDQQADASEGDDIIVDID